MLVKLPCNKKCVNRKYWTGEMPFVSHDTRNWKTQLNVVLACLSCVYFIRTDNFIYEA